MLNSILTNMSEFEENLPRRVYPLLEHEETFAQLDEFIRTSSSPKIFVLMNPVLEQRVVGLGKKTLITEFCYAVKTKTRVNIKWLDATSYEVFQHQLGEFAHHNLNVIGVEQLFAKLDTLKWPCLFVIKNLYSWETIGDFLAQLVETSKCKAVVISRSNLKRGPHRDVRFVEFQFKPSLDQCQRYLNTHLKSRLKSHQVNRLLELVTSNYQKIVNPFELEKLTYYIKYNYLYTTDSMIGELAKTECFRLTQVLQFVKQVDAQSTQILLFGKYLYADFVPIELVLSLLEKNKLFEIQNSVKFLLELDLVELVEEQNAKALKINRIVLNEIKEQSIEKRAKVEHRLAEVLNQLFSTNQCLFYLSAVSFLLQSKHFSIKNDQNFSKISADLCFLVGNFDYKRMKLESAIKFAELGYKSQPKKFSSLLGMCYFRLLQHAKALTYFESIKDDDNDDDNENNTSAPLFTIGKCYFELGDYANASKHLKRAYERKQADLEPLECVNMLALALERTAKYSIAIKYNLELVNLVKAVRGLKKTDLIIDIYVRLGFEYDRLENPSKCLAYLEKAFEIASKTTDHKKIVWLLNYIGRTNMTLLNYDQAISDFRTSYEIVSAKPDFSLLDLAEPLNLIGIGHRKKGDFDLARKYMEKAFRLRFRHHGNCSNFDVVDSYFNLGILNRNLGDLVKYEEYLRQAYEVKKELAAQVDLEKLNNLENFSANVDKKFPNERLQRIFGNFDVKKCARIYLLCKDNYNWFKDLIDFNDGADSETLSKDDYMEFIKWFDALSLSAYQSEFK